MPGTFGNILTKILKSSTNVCNAILRNIWNSEILGKQYFPDNLKLANVTPAHKKKDPTLVENYRPVSVLPSVSNIFERIRNLETAFKLNRLIFVTYFCPVNVRFDPGKNK